MKKPIVACLLFLACLNCLPADTFAYKFTPGDRYRIVTQVDETVLYNGQVAHTVRILDKIALTVTNVTGGSGTFTALFQVSELYNTYAGTYVVSNEESSIYTVDPRGHFTIDPMVFFPLLRDIPLFPAQDLKPGDVWNAAGEEVHDFREPYGIDAPYRVKVGVQYTYLGRQIVSGRDLARIDIQYSYMAKVKLTQAVKGPFYPISVSGTFHKILLWDPALGRMDSYTEDFDVFYYLSNGTMVEFVGKHTGTVTPAPLLDKKQAVDDISREIEKNKLQGVRVEATDAGVKITLENIQFQPDSDTITAGENRKIEFIASLLKKYPNRDIKLVGHTAAVGTPESCLELSLRRSAAVGGALSRLGAVRADQMVIQGKGLTEPIAPNDTEAGRIKNRRVEIFILEN